MRDSEGDGGERRGRPGWLVVIVVLALVGATFGAISIVYRSVDASLEQGIEAEPME